MSKETESDRIGTNGKKGPKWYAWVIFGIAFLMVFVALGFGSSTKGTFLTSVTGSLGLARSRFTIADSLRYITTGILAVFLGRTVEKIGLRKMAGFGFLFLTLSFVSNAFSAETAGFLNDIFPEAPVFFKELFPYLPFYLGGIFLGAGLAWTTTSMVGYLVENWFSNGKGTIMGILLAANGLGGVASEFIVTKIIFGVNGEIPDAESHWKLAYLIIAGLFLTVGVIAVLIIREKPSDIGTEPLWQDREKKAKRGLNWEGYTPKEALRMPTFYIAGICIFLTGFTLQSMTNISKPYMYDLGFPKDYVIYVFALHALVLMLSKTMAGVAYDTIGIKWTYLICCTGAVIAIGSLFFLRPVASGITGIDAVLPWGYSIFSCLGMPLETVMIPLTVSYLFGKQGFKKVLGYFIAFNTFGYATGVPIANLVHDTAGTYRPIIPFLVISILIPLIVMEICFARADRKRREG